MNTIKVDRGALKMALNVLDRAGKAEVADALRASCVDSLKCDKVARIRERVKNLSPADYYKWRKWRSNSIPIELTASIKSDILYFIDQLDRDQS